MTNCYICEKGTLKAKKVPYTLYGEHVGDFKAEVCDACGETFFAEEISKEITNAAKEKGLWGLGAKTKIGQSGNTLDIRLPKKIIDFFKLKKGEEVSVYPESRRRIVVEF